MDPLISCIVAVYNGERFVAKCLESLLGQTYARTEILVVDDGSQDRTAEIVRGFGPRVRYIHQENGGHRCAQNAGIRAARGTFLAFNDHDDLWAPTKLERQLTAFAANPDLGICVTHVQNVWEMELEAEAAAFAEHPRSRPMAGFVLQSLLARREAFATVGPLDEGLLHAGDTDWFMRAEHAGIAKKLLPDVLVYRRLHESNRSRVFAKRSQEEYLGVVKAALDRKRRKTD